METACDPGDSDVFIYGAIFIPLLKAFLQSRAAQSMTPGFDVLVQEVIAAITTDPCLSLYYDPSNINLDSDSFSSSEIPKPLKPEGEVKQEFQSFLSSFRET